MRRSRLVLSSLLALPLLAPPAPALAAWPHVASVNVPVCNLPASNPQIHATISDGAGGAIVVWQDQRSGANDIYAQHVLASGSLDPAWPANGRAVCTATNYQNAPVLVSDGAGGAIVAWYDYRNAGIADVYAQHVLASGAVDPAWPADGRAVCTATSEQISPAIATDGAGGAIVAWDDQRTGAHDIYAHHVLASGAVDPAWPADGRAVCTAVGDQSLPSLVSDGAGGAVLAWQDARSGTADIYAGHVRFGGTVDPGWPVNGVAVCTATNFQQSPLVVTDGAGGAIACWIDLRPGGHFDVYAQHVLAAGYVDGVWPADGRAICAAAGNQVFPAIVADGGGGAFLAWDDRRSAVNPDIYAQHVFNTGAVDPAWPADGRAVCAASGQQASPAITSDGSTGVLISWTDNRNGDNNTDIFAQHVSAAGVADAAWAANGNAVSTATSIQQASAIVADGAGGGVVTWIDLRTGAFGIYAQRVARHGVLGTPEPVIASVKDVPNDQGGKVKVSFDASWLDTDASALVDHYWILRSVPAAAVAAALRAGATLEPLAGAGARGAFAGAAALAPADGARRLFAADAAATIYWEFVASQNALHLVNGYSYLAATTGDSTGADNTATQFMVTAWNAAGTQYWSSAPVGGYSVDNLPPYTPLSLTGSYGPGTTALHWAPNTDADLAGYRVYRGGSAGFVPGPGNLLASPPDTGFADAASGWFYKLSAVDTHGNESGWALLAATGTDDVGEQPLALALRAPLPNPSAADVQLRLALPRAGRVDLAILDVAGRRVRRLLAGHQPSGEHTVRWDGRGDSGDRLAPGLYFARLATTGRVLTQRIVRME